ncbi:VOC family protein, partial [Falsiroseomonas oryziterrae]|uniref:VOC family protein n=1 Tax=Falsiroseomonas oryziterrae TaxID=2911368 RepID=UPI001F3EAF78
MTGTALALDHIGLCARDPAPLWAAWEGLGFALSPVAQQSGRRTPDGPVEPFGSGNRCAFLRHGYVELLGILDDTLFANGVDRFVARYEGAHILALAMDDAEANLARLRRGGLQIPGVAWLQRPVEPGGPTARFARLPFPDAPEGRVQLVQHLTPELVWDARWMGHRNGAEALESVIVASANPAETTARLARLGGMPAEPDALAGFRLRLPGGARAAGPDSPAMETRIR